MNFDSEKLQDNDIASAGATTRSSLSEVEIFPLPSATTQFQEVSDYPDGGSRAWATVAGAWCAMFCSLGWINSLGVWQTYYKEGSLRHYSLSAISWIISIETFALFAGAPVFGKLFDSYGPRWLMICGILCHVFGMMIASLSTEYYQFVLTQSICSGFGASAIFQATSNSVNTWFLQKKNLALGIASSGSSAGGIVFPIMIDHLLHRVGYPWTMRICAFLSLGMLLMASLTITSRLKHVPKPLDVMVYIRPLGERRFGVVVCSFFLVFLGLLIPNSYIGLEAESHGMRQSLRSYLLPILNAASIVGRILVGQVADRLGTFNVTVCTECIAGVLVLALWIPANSTATLIAFAVLYGFFSGAIVASVTATIARLSEIRQIGVRNGTNFFFVSIAALAGGPIAGALVEGHSFAHAKIFSGIVIVAGSMLLLVARLFQSGLRFAVRI